MICDGADIIPGARGCNAGNGGRVSAPSAGRICAATNPASSCGRGNPTPGTSTPFVSEMAGNSTPLMTKIFRSNPLIPEVGYPFIFA